MAPVTVAVAGCAHGDMDKIYETLAYLEEENDTKADILLCCGDFQAVRNLNDLQCMAVPKKYQQLQTFYKYYSGEVKAPILTVFIGGNHEASNYLAELPYGGWVAPNVYYLGYAGVVTFRGLRIAGFSGIFRQKQFDRGHFEFPPYNPDALRTAYYVRSLDMFRLKQLKDVDVMLSHDWPTYIHRFGDWQRLFRMKPFLRQDAECGQLGNPFSEELMKELKPKFWFSAHHHVKFSAVVSHKDRKETQFLALDKCLPRGQFLELVDMEATEEAGGLGLDPQWLAVLRATDHLLNATPQIRYVPKAAFHPSLEAVEKVVEDLGGELGIPANFRPTAEAHPKGDDITESNLYFQNPQTTEFCEKLQITDLNQILYQRYLEEIRSRQPVRNPDEIAIDDLEEEEAEAVDNQTEVGAEGGNPEEIPIEEEEFVPPPFKRGKSDEEDSGAVLKMKRRNLDIYSTPPEDLI